MHKLLRKIRAEAEQKYGPHWVELAKDRVNAPVRLQTLYIRLVTLLGVLND